MRYVHVDSVENLAVNSCFAAGTASVSVLYDIGRTTPQPVYLIDALCKLT